MKNKHLISASAHYFVETNEIEVSQWDTYHLLKFAALDIVPKRHSNILFEAMDSVVLSELEFKTLIDLVQCQIDVYAREMTAECIKYCLDYVNSAVHTFGLREVLPYEDDVFVSAHYNAYNKSVTSGAIEVPIV